MPIRHNIKQIQLRSKWVTEPWPHYVFDGRDFKEVKTLKEDLLGNVGTVSYRDEEGKYYQIDMLPSMPLCSGQFDESKEYEVLLTMLGSMDQFPSLKFKENSLDIKRTHIFELFISMFLKDAETLVKQGLKSNYALKEENLHCFKGKLMVGNHVRDNAAHKERFWVQYSEFDLNTPENRLVKATLYLLSSQSGSSKNRRKIRQLLMFFDGIEASVNYDLDFSSVTTSRNTTAYHKLLSWARHFLKNSTLTSGVGSQNSYPFLFKMSDVYENYVVKNVKRIFTAEGWFVETQLEERWLFDDPRIFKLIPDIVLKRDGRTVILDTKWKKIEDDRSKNYCIEQKDIYQMYAYAKRFNAKKVFLLYPLNNNSKVNNLKFSESEGSTVEVHLVDLGNISDNLKCLLNKIENSSEYQ